MTRVQSAFEAYSSMKGKKNKNKKVKKQLKQPKDKQLKINPMVNEEIAKIVKSKSMKDKNITGDLEREDQQLKLIDISKDKQSKTNPVVTEEIAKNLTSKNMKDNHVNGDLDSDQQLKLIDKSSMKKKKGSKTQSKQDREPQKKSDQQPEVEVTEALYLDGEEVFLEDKMEMLQPKIKKKKGLQSELHEAHQADVEKPKQKKKKVSQSHEPHDSPVYESPLEVGPSPPKPTKSMPAETKSLKYNENSLKSAKDLFAWIIHPITMDDFFNRWWEKRPLHISREGHRDYFNNVLSTPAIDAMLRKNTLYFGKNIDITSYVNGKRETHNPSGRAQATVVWDYYRNGCSVRLLNPQTYHPKLHALNASLQEVFGSFVGANVYLTPPNSQGFAPHYDDIEAFVLQLEGKKQWKIYASRNSSEILPRSSSRNFAPVEIGKPILDVLLEPGDILYFPRGLIHQASTVSDHHSLHVTISTYQHNSWADFLEKLVPAALASAIEDDEEFRQGMPRDVLQHVGVVHSESKSPQRNFIMNKLKTLFSKLYEYAPVDAAADQLATEFLHDALPPFLTQDEKKCSSLEDGERMGSDGNLVGAVNLNPKTKIRLTRSNILRLVSEAEAEDTVKVFHCMDNSLEYHGEDLQSFDIPIEVVPGVEHLIKAFPKFTSISSLPVELNEHKMQIALELWERGLVLTSTPLTSP